MLWRSRRLAAVLLCVLGLLIVAAGLAVYAVRAQSSPPWKRDGLVATTVHFLAVGHSHPGLAFAATETGVYRRNGGGGWKQVLPAGSVWGVTLLPDDRTVIAGDIEGYVNISADRGSHWRRVHVAGNGVYAVSTQPNAPRHVLAGADGGLYLSLDGGMHWQRRLPLKQSAGAAFAWSPGYPYTVYAGAVAGGSEGATQVYVSRDAGASWRLFGHHLDSHGGIMSLAAFGGHVYAGTMGNRLWIVGTHGSQWHASWIGIPERQHVSGIATVPERSRLLFAATLGAGVYRSKDAGTHWLSVSDGLPRSDSQQIVLSLTYDALRHVLLAGTVDGVYELHTAPS